MCSRGSAEPETYRSAHGVILCQTLSLNQTELNKMIYIVISK